MKYYFLLLLLLGSRFLAGAQTEDSAILHRFISRELTDASDKTADGKFYNYLPIRMAEGDIIYILYESKDYAVALGVRDSMTHAAVKEDNDVFLSTIGSKVVLPFHAKTAGPYYFFFTTKEKEAKGKYAANVYYYYRERDKITDSSSFCDKLLYIADNTYLGFEFLKREKKESTTLETYVPSISLLPDATCEIQHNLDDAYICSFPVSKDLAALNKKFEALQKQITRCGGGYKKKAYTAAMSPEPERKDFVRRVDFILSGTLPYDMHATHAAEKIKSRLSLRIIGTEKNGYTLRLTIE